MTPHPLSSPSRILLVEDNPADVRLAQEALAEEGVATDLAVVRDGVEALAYLRREDPYATSPRPDLILLDLNLPRKDGRAVLAEIKEDAELRRIPVIVLSSSRAARDVSRCYGLHANCYIAKPVQLQQFVDVVRKIQEFWLQTAELPDGPYLRPGGSYGGALAS